MQRYHKFSFFLLRSVKGTKNRKKKQNYFANKKYDKYICIFERKNVGYIYFNMADIFKIRKLGVCRKELVDARTAFTYYELKAGEVFRSRALPLNYILFVMRGVIDVHNDGFRHNRFQADEMVFLLRSSAVQVKAEKKTKLYVMYFDTFLSSCDQQLFKAYLPDVEKITYDFRPIRIPKQILLFLGQMHAIQLQKVDCMHFNSLKHREFFIFLRNFCPREDLVMFLAPLIGRSLNFRSKVLEKYAQLNGGSVTDLANRVGMGRKNFDKHFREEFGTSPAKWMQQEKAKRLFMFFSEPGATISDAMDMFHFNSPSHFNRFCHQYYQKSPGMMIKEAGHVKKRK